jgi:hypothetical protein
MAGGGPIGGLMRAMHKPIYDSRLRALVGAMWGAGMERWAAP